MPTITHETEEGTFVFSQGEAVKALQISYTDEEKDLLEFLESQAGDTVEIPKDNRVFPYTILKLLNQGQGSVNCKACGKQYLAAELRPFTLGAGESPFKVNVGFKESLRKRIFGKPKRLPLFGGKGFCCPQGHELISVITWRT